MLAFGSMKYLVRNIKSGNRNQRFLRNSRILEAGYTYLSICCLQKSKEIFALTLMVTSISEYAEA